MSRAVRCANEKEPHFFDADKYSLCPHCGAPKRAEGGDGMAAALETDDGKSVKKQKKRGIFTKWSKSKASGDGAGNIKKTEGVSETGKIQTSGMPYEGVGGFGNWVGMAKEEENPPSEADGTSFPETEVLLKPVAVDWKREEKAASPSFSQPFQAAHKDDETGPDIAMSPPPLPSNDKRAAGGRQTLDDIKTQTIYGSEQGEEPVTGWLVCIKGEYRGSSFSLKAGVNVISRDASADVCLKKDAKVSRSMHALVIYEPKKKRFFLGNGERSLTYYNGELLDGRRELRPYDSIEIGMGTYMFIPFCGEQFDWDQE